MDSSPIKLAEKSRIFVCVSGNVDSDGDKLGEVRSYGEQLSAALQCRLTFHQQDPGDSLARIITAVEGCDLVLFFDPRLSTLEEILFGSAWHITASRTPAAVLIVHQLRWPPQEILLAIRIERVEAKAIVWAGRLAHLFDAELTILPLVPFQPGVFQMGGRQQSGIESVLAPSMPTGEMFRAMLQPISHWQIRGTLRVRQGDPAEQLSLEIARSDYDLIVIGPGKPER